MEHSICMPLYIYDRIEENAQQITLFDFIANSKELSGPKYKKRYAISDVSLKKFQSIYGRKVDKESIFYYIYAVLQHREYVNNYEDNLAKEMPRIPMLENFPEYVRIGKELALLHLDYEKKIDVDDIGLIVEKSKDDYYVERMQFCKKGKEIQKDIIIFNNYITIKNIPIKTYDYVVNGKSAIEWIMERYAITQDKNSRIVDNPNDVNNSSYIFELLISVINVSIKTQDLLDELPEYKEI